MKRTILTSLSLLCMVFCTYAQDDGGEGTTDKISYVEAGQVSVGMRTTTSLFGHDNIPGLGVGGQTRWQIWDFLNTEWFADWITIDLNGAGIRNNAHIGWSVMFYPYRYGRIVPYFVAGHCFDYAKVTPVSTPYLDRTDDVVTRWSSAIQAGIGSHFYLNERFDVSLQAQYMLHLGQHLDYEVQETGAGYYLETNGGASGPGIEGHILMTASLNIRIADLW